jgi:hypothetical protein
MTLSPESAELLTKVREDILKDVTQLLKKNSQGEPAETDSNLGHGILEVQQALKTLSSMMTVVPKENIILQNIFFSSMNMREQTMDSAERGTFDWIFEEEKVDHNQSEDEIDSEYLSDEDTDSSVGSDLAVSEDETLETGNNVDNSLQNSRPASQGSAEDVPDKEESDQIDKIRREELEKRATARTNFLTWLKSDGGLFHISGKAGSGKSTLMKFLCSRERTKEELQAWAGEGRKLVFARFYFWKSSGDRLQMTLPGLYRSILFETLKYCPNLIPELFKKQWESVNNDLRYVHGDLISDFDVQKAFESLTAKGSFPQHRFCFFVDGLDEYHGNVMHQLKLARDLQRWSSAGDVKFCVSSRPYIEFDKLVESNDRRMHLHELTRHDIYLFSRKMIEDNLGEDLEWVKFYYLRLVEQVVQKSEGVFLWARLVVCSLLEGMIRRDKEDVLKYKLDVLPPDINGLYPELLSTLSPDDRVRAEKMMLLTAHNTFWAPLGSIGYAFIDQLSDPHFPPRDGKNPVSWGSADETAKDVELQLKSLTKGLLETAAPKQLDLRFEKISWMRSVQFFHGTVRDFVLENSKLDDTASQFPSLTKIETFYRLWLAELILVDRPERVLVWNSSNIDLYNGFEQELPSNLLEAFSRVIEGENDMSEPVRDGEYHQKVFMGIARGANSWYPKGRASFTNLAACTGQTEYVVQQIAKNPELLRGNGESHILLSAALNGRSDTVRALLQHCSSPMDCVAEQLPGFHIQPTADEIKTKAIPIWMVFTAQLVTRQLELGFNSDNLYDVLELLLQNKRVDASNCFFLLCKNYETPQTHFITLTELIQDAKPDNMDQLLALVQRGSGNSYVNSAAQLLTKFNPFVRQKESMVDKETRRYIPFFSEGISQDLSCVVVLLYLVI